MNAKDFTVAEVAALAGCHRNTVLRYERQGLIHSVRDANRYRRYTIEEAEKLKELLNFRIKEVLDRLRAEHLGMTYKDYVARKDLLLKQIEEVKGHE